MNLKDIREAMYAQADYGPKNSTGADERMNKFINRAYNLIALEAPFLFFEEILRVATQPDVIADSNNTVSFAPDLTWDKDGNPMFPKGATGSTLQPNPWVLKQDAVGAGGTLIDWPTDRSWDGRVIEIQDSNNVWHRNIIRTVWNANYPTEQVTNAPTVPTWNRTTPATGKILSLWTPWDTSKYGSGPFRYRIYTQEYALPDDIIEVHSTRLWKTNNSWPMTVLSQEDAERQNILDKHTDVAKGIPRVIYRRQHKQIQGPSVAPDAALSNTVDFGQYDNAQSITKYPRWKGPEPAGQFEYVITYSWGKRDIWFRNQGMSLWNDNPYDWSNPEYGTASTAAEWTDADGRKGAANRSQAGRNRYREPLYESAPSPVSTKVVTVNASDTGQGVISAGGAAIVLTLPNIQYMQGYMMMGSGPLASGHNGAFVGDIPPQYNEGFFRVNSRLSGWHVRIYRRRLTADFTNYTLLNTGTPSSGIVEPGQWVEGLKKLDLPDAFFLLAEVNVDWDNQGYFIDDGTILPDYHRRLRDTHGYQTIGMYPTPNDRYEVEIRCIRRPKELKDNQDVPLIHAEACDLLVDRALQLLYETEGNINMMRLAKGRYERNLVTLSKRYGDLASSSVPMLKRLSRATPGYRTSLRYRQWWNTPNQ